MANQFGYEVENINMRAAKIKGMGGLLIDKGSNCWHWFSQHITGGGPIQFVMHFQNKNWKEAVTELINEEGNFQKVEIKARSSVTEDKSQFELPKQNSTYKHIFAYLIKTRKIDSKIIDYFVKEKLLYENDKKSCVFVGKDKEGIVRYANIRGTNTVGKSFKGEAAKSDKRFGFCRPGTSNTITIFEAPIDILSYMTIFKLKNASNVIKNDTLLSLGGIEDIALKQYLTDHKHITKIQSGLDMDEAGDIGWKKICEDFPKYQLERLTIPEKDWNQYLIEHYDSFNETNRPEIEKNHNKDNNEISSISQYKYYTIDKTNDGKYIIKSLSNNFDIVSISWPIGSVEAATSKLEKIMKQERNNGFKVEEVPISIMEKTRDFILNEKENLRQIELENNEFELEV